MQKAPFKRVNLTPEQRRLWENTLSACSWIAPGFVHIIYTMLSKSGHDDVALFTEEIPTAAGTDGYQLIFRPSLFFKFNLMERVFAVLHEVMHEILNHCWVGYAFQLAGKITVAGKSLPYDRVFANIVQDFVINAILIASKMGQFNTDWLYDKDIATENDQWIEVYFKLWKDVPKIKLKLNCPEGSEKGDGDGDGSQDMPQGSPGQFDVHLDPHQSEGKDPHEAPEREDVQWELAVAAAAEIQRAQGKMPGALEHFFNEVLKPKVDWTEHIRGEIMRIMGSGGYSWQRLDRRLITRGIGAPGVTGYGAGLIVIGGDTSGSIFSDKTLVARFIGEMAGILEDVNPEEVHSVWCDTEVKRVDVLRDVNDLRAVIDKIPGGGGTSFVPVFKYIEENDLQPDVLVYLTDMYGTFPKHAPDYPVIWGSITDTPAPWGKVVRIPVSAD